jgi:hypothetical protein
VTGGDGSFFISNGSSVRRFDYLTTDVGDDEIEIPLPEDFRLTKAYPNPFNATVTIAFSSQIKAESQAEVVVYNVLGQVVRNLPINASDLERGLVQWDGRNSGGATVSSGIYLARLVDTDGSAVANALKLILLK